MKKNKFRLFLTFIAVIGFLASPARAALGLQQIMANQGALAVGQAVLAAAQSVYANNTDPAIIQQQLIAILNEAAATGNESAVRYAIVAVMMAGGVENLAAVRAAINSSDVFTNFPALTANTVAGAEAVMITGGGAGGTAGGGGGGDGGGTGGQGGGGDQGGGPGALLPGIDLNNLLPPGSLTDYPTPNDPGATPV